MSAICRTLLFLLPLCYGWYGGGGRTCKLPRRAATAPRAETTTGSSSGEDSLGAFPLLSPSHEVLTADQLAKLNPVQLAFIGDAVFELHARTLFAWPPKKAVAQRAAAVEMVRAESQSRLLRRLLASKWPITEHERGLLRKGRNAAGRGPPRLARGAYGEASGLEALLGYLYLADRPRLEGLLLACSDLDDPTPRPEDEVLIEW
jgi:ribonuclease-3 family protein